MDQYAIRGASRRGASRVLARDGFPHRRERPAPRRSSAPGTCGALPNTSRDTPLTESEATEPRTATEETTLEPAALEDVATELAARAPVRPDSPTFAELGARAETVAALTAVGITRAFAI